MAVPSRHNCRERRCASLFTIMTSSMMVRMVVFRLKGSTLLWRKMLLPLLNMAVDDVSWERFEGWFQERYLSKEFVEHQLKEFDTLRQGSHTVPEYEAHFMELLWYAPAY
jgi:hypothetical protein